MSLTFNIADLHGRNDLVIKALSAIYNYDKFIHGEDTLVFTGDYIDRGPDSKGVIQLVKFLQGTKTEVSGFKKVVALLGNHETFMLDAQKGEGASFWTSFNGGDMTYKSYGVSSTKAGVFPIEHIQWIRGLPFYYDDGKRLYVHAGVRSNVALTDQTEEDMLWMLYGQKRPFEYAAGLVDEEYNIYGGHDDVTGIRHVVHGHHQFKDGPKLFKYRSNFDTLAWYYGRLVIGVFDNDKIGGPIDTIEVKGPSARLTQGL